MTTSSIRRQMKNIVNNYSEAEIKVREATSNDPWGPSSSLMTEIADLTYNVVAFSEIMSMVWKRLNDHGKNWRHVYKALTLLDYLIKTGSERVAQQCRENIFAIQTLKDFQYIDRDGKDQGINVREKSKQLVALLKDEERLKVERVQALKTKERMAQVATGVGSNQITFGRGSSQPNLSTSYSEQEYGKAGGSPASYHGSPEASLCPQHRTGAMLGQSEELQPLSQRHPCLPHLGLASHPNGDWAQPCLTCDRAARATSPRVSSELEQARPQTSGEEELQLQLALAMSREVAEQSSESVQTARGSKEERLRRGDDLRLQMALEESRRDTVKVPKKKEVKACCKPGSHSQQTTLLDLMDALPSSGPVAQKTEPWSTGTPANQTNPWGGTVAPANISDPWPSFGTKPAASVDPWGVPTTASIQSVPKNSDPWAASQQPASDAGKTADAWGAAKPSPASGSFELFSNFNGTVKDDFSEFDNLRTSKKPAESGASVPPQDSRTTSPDLFESQSLTSASSKPSSARKTPESFLGPNAALVNLDSLVTKPNPPAQSLNPFLAPGAAAPAPVNPFQVNQPQPLTLNQLRGSPVLGSSASFGSGPGVETVAPMPSVAPHSALGATGSSLTPLGPTAMNMVGSVGIPPSAAQPAGTTNPFLL
ncbi:epsin-2 isoform X1 [Rattus norvegicus]|uniref:Epsin 2 n=1 Tax=Rattus norvegicus TaxID=10116 RepID=F1LQ45_RAT|nr:epsin-2 isoform X1 [Rattus norvegicus]XP_017452995.1 epsin-2 isoform X1 [Rattus norvegicus]XP_017452996.1 epsin-2 isoform X1 [Rattus norvegicus]XP_017452997.1 epsin-2 isoform X1 [Rattus norvegicus]XP_017452999.1 epsin-2 isoform X1 [Rattus norvegicus]XP_017453000.1 epsin-2 isoform X1 [Rattus norvegicus]XP_038942668.1 epsin-2 isoform X1 [Rattus norvegicus]XP_038942669.1 epsin-2 isoform X1 [Rattus norvegicus]XP_038942670.1 epsin-2 isoform X1 [Rattus norvegicus]XP_038942671.1 epsin-2 isofor|eukprot:XP_006246583.1 PREDICTED: epsin-2 isoform X1 [Rattus norvegicus]